MCYTSKLCYTMMWLLIKTTIIAFTMIWLHWFNIESYERLMFADTSVESGCEQSDITCTSSHRSESIPASSHLVRFVGACMNHSNYIWLQTKTTSLRLHGRDGLKHFQEIPRWFLLSLQICCGHICCVIRAVKLLKKNSSDQNSQTGYSFFPNHISQYRSFSQ